jgi:hypothetical protein
LSREDRYTVPFEPFEQGSDRDIEISALFDRREKRKTWGLPESIFDKTRVQNKREVGHIMRLGVFGDNREKRQTNITVSMSNFEQRSHTYLPVLSRQTDIIQSVVILSRARVDAAREKRKRHKIS